MFTSGIHFGWPSPSVPELLSPDYPFDISKEDASYITLTANVGNVIGSLVGSFTVDWIGRKNSILCIGLPQFVCFGLIALSNYTPVLLYIARTIGGIADAMCFVVIPIYIGEVAEPKVRGTLGSLLIVMFSSGIFFANLVAMFLKVASAALLYLVLPIAFAFSFWRMPESPYYGIMKNNLSQAESALKFLRRKGDVQKELAGITSDVNRQLSEPGSYIDLFTIDSNRKACIAMAGMRTIQQFFGISAILVYSQVLFEEATDAISPQVGATLLILVQAVVSVVPSYVVDILGRKPLMISSCVGCGAVLLLLGVFFTLRDYTQLDTSTVQWIPVAGMMVFMVAFSWGMGTVVNLLLGELFSASIKAKALGLMNIVFGVTMLASTKFLQTMVDYVGLAVPFYVYGTVAVSGAVFCYYSVPETRGKTLEQIQQEFKGKK